MGVCEGTASSSLLLLDPPLTHPYEGAITPGFMIVTSMFYTRAEQTKRVGYWCTLLHTHRKFAVDWLHSSHEWCCYNLLGLR